MSLQACPHPACTGPLGLAPSSGVCTIHPTIQCPTCTIRNRASASFCRRCGGALSPGIPNLETSNAPPASFATFNGSFRRPPLASRSSLYAVTSGGILQSLSMLPGASAIAIAQLPPAAGSNTAAIVHISRLGKMQPGETLLVAHRRGVDAVVVATGSVHHLHEAGPGSELAVNDEGSSSAFRGVAASPTHFAWAERAADAKLAFMLQAFAPGKAAEHVFALAGTESMGPVLRQGLLIGCTAQEIGIYDSESGRSSSAPLPRGFEPMLARTPGRLNVTPGTIPLTATRTDAGHIVFVAGMENGLEGFLHIALPAGKSTFAPVGRGSSVTSNPDGSLSLASEGEMRVLGRSPSPAIHARAQFGMPATSDGTCLLYFAEESGRGSHRLNISESASVSSLDLVFEDPACTEMTCGPPLLSGTSVAVPYFSPTAQSDPTLKVALWNLSH